ncbi:MAG: PAS domain-containing protein [Candidatus Omnitrophica bacterium]|jgi:PAS domain S-box-containing protein|nr:PAS domain-containing protein [Candidatus Omnitrophota bacterium]
MKKEGGDLVIQAELEYAEGIVTAVREPMIVLNKELKIVSASKAFYGVFRITPKDTIGKFIYDLGDRQWDIPELRRLLNEILPQQKTIDNFQVQHNFAQIGRRIMILNAEWIPKDAVKPQLILLAIEDITEREKIEASLRDSRLKIRAVFDQTFQFIGLMTVGGILIEANKTALDFSGIEISTVLNKPFWETPWWAHSKALQKKLRDSIRKVAAGEFVRFEATHIAKDGTLRYIDFSLKPVKDESGRVIFMIPEGRDITERKELEEDLKNSYTELDMRVKVRTAELSRANEELHKEISHSRQIEKELNAKMQALERANKSTEDKESKIEQLREKIKELERRPKKVNGSSKKAE